MITCIIVDDERAARSTLSNYLNAYCPQVSILGEAKDVEEAEKLIKEKHPDFIFLDVEMPRGNAFDLLERFPKPRFQVIFVTAFNHYAIQALNQSACYFILKPIDIDELINATEKVEHLLASQEEQVNLDFLSQQLKQQNQDKIILPLLNGFEIITIKDIIRCQADDNMTHIFLRNEKPRLVSKTLKHFENILLGHHFFRCHKSHLVNLKEVKQFIKGKTASLVLTDESHVDVSPPKKKALLLALNYIT